MAVEVKIPALGESVSEGVIARWLKQSGDVVRVDEPLLELETDKAAMEIPATSAGRLEIVAPEGSTVQVGAVVARIEPADGEAPRKSPAKSEPPRAERAAAKSESANRESTAPARADGSERDEPALSPAVRRLVAENAIDPTSIEGTGKGGRITKEDVLRHLESNASRSAEAAERKAPAASRPAESAPAEPANEAAPPPERTRPSPASAPEPLPPKTGDDVERTPMTRLRKRIAERLVEAQRTAAILTTFNEIDMSTLMALRKQHKERFEKTHGVGLGFMSLFARACLLALRDVPVVNSAIDGDDVVHHRRVHLGIAVATDAGLVVPVVRNANSKSLAELEKAIGELARLARDRKLTADHLSGGTFSITNGGVFGSLMSTPILNPPNSGILGMHKIQDRPVAIDGQVVIRPMMYVALSYDHRLVDGREAITFLVRVKERIEDPARMLLEV